MPRTLVIVNPVAGRGRVRALWPKAADALRAAGVVFEVAETDAPRAAVALAEQAAQDYDAVVAAGGDGTVHEVANGLLNASGKEPTVPLGVMPLGSGDDFAKMLHAEPVVGRKAPSIDDAAAIIARGTVRRFDAGRLRADGNAVWFANGMDIGFGARGAANAQSMPSWLKGMNAYLGALAKTLVDYPVPRVSLRIDDAPPVAQATTMTAVMLGRCFGSGFWVAPDAVSDDGLFDLMIADALGRAAILALVPRIMRGAHVGDPRIRMRRARRVVITAPEPFDVEADGEIPFPAARRVEVTLSPAKLTVLA